MAKFVETWLLLLICGSFVDFISTFSTCKEGHYFNLELTKCFPCTVCYERPIIRICSEAKDTQCGIGSDFSFLNLPNTYGEKTVGIPTAPKVLSSEADERQWQTVAFVLIGIISVLVVIAAAIIIISCHKFRHYSWLCKTVSNDAGKYGIKTLKVT